jgi:hypothetical protein
MGARTVLPESYYPCSIDVDRYEGSRDKGTPGLHLSCIVLEGPYQGTEIFPMDAVLWLTPGGEQAKGQGRALGKINHMVKSVTGSMPDATVLKNWGVALSQPTEVMAVYRDVWLFFNQLDSAQKLKFMAEYARVKAWGGKKAVIFVQYEQEQMSNSEGELLYLDEAGETTTVETDTPRMVDRNRIGNIYGYNDTKHGIAAWKKSHLPAQERAAAGE